MRERKVKYAVLAGLVAGGFAGVSLGDIVYQDNFDGTAGTVSGRTPDQATGLDGGTAGATWTSDATTSADPDNIFMASGGTYSGTGTTNSSVGTFTTGADANDITNAYVPITPQIGLIYDAHLAIAPSGVGASGNWLGFSFVGSNSTFFNGHTTGGGSSALSNDASTGLIILKGSGAVQSFGGTVNGSGQITSSTANGVLNATLISPGTTTPVYTGVDIFLNTTGAQWTVSWSLNGATSGADFGTYTYPVGDNPTTIAGLAFGTNKLTGAVSDFSLTTVPEPTSMISLITASGLLLLGRRRSAAL